MSKLQRYDASFLRDFRTPITVNTAALANVEPEAPPPPPPPVFKESDVEQAREAGKKLGYAEGFEAGLAQAKTEAAATARDTQHQLEKIERHIMKLVMQYQKLVSEQSGELAELVLTIARKVTGDALEANGDEAVKKLVERCLPVVLAKPKVLIEVAPATLSRIDSAIRRQMENAGFTGEIELRANEKLEPSDVRIDWVQGAAQRSVNDLWQDIEALLYQMPLSPTVPAVRIEEKKQPAQTLETGADHG